MRTLPTKMMHIFAPFGPLYFRTSHPACPGALDGRGTLPRETEGEFGLENDELRSTQEIPSLPPSVEPCCMVQRGSSPRPAGAPGGRLRTRRTAYSRRRRSHWHRYAGNCDLKKRLFGDRCRRSRPKAPREYIESLTDAVLLCRVMAKVQVTSSCVRLMPQARCWIRCGRR
jgi:hypothetical protein